VQDDLLISREGVDSLTEDELRATCKARGLRKAFGAGAAEYMRTQLEDWIDLHLHRGLPSSLLLMSRWVRGVGLVGEVR
jgi:LETM1 and EF-hand domain-containing protein 1